MYDDEEKYNELLKKHKMLQKVSCGVSIGKGWYQIIDDLCSKIEETGIDVKVEQVKEKFGGLRFYIRNGSEQIYDLIQKAEWEAEKTCEACGAPGKMSTKKRWLKTVCEEHDKE